MVPTSYVASYRFVLVEPRMLVEWLGNLVLLMKVHMTDTKPHHTRHSPTKKNNNNDNKYLQPQSLMTYVLSSFLPSSYRS